LHKTTRQLRGVLSIAVIAIARQSARRWQS